MFEEKFAAIDVPSTAFLSLDFWIGGYGSDLSRGHDVWQLHIENGVCSDPIPVQGAVDGGTGLFWGGQPGPINRLVIGFDQGLPDVLRGHDMPEGSVVAVTEVLRSQLAAHLVSPIMPVQDAIDLGDFLVETTKRYFRFLPGANVVGGETDIAVVTKYEGFKWIRRKHFYPSKLNPLETDHA